MMHNPEASVIVSETVAHDAAALGVARGDTLMIHSSVHSLGLEKLGLHNGLESVLQGLLSAVGPEGTLLFPALSYVDVGPAHPYFDASETKSCVGAFAEFVRLRPNTLRSTHPTHSICAIGARSREMTASHHLDTTPVGSHSPLALLPQYDGQILMIGCGGRPNTSMHGVEELVEPPYLYSGVKTDYECVDLDGVSQPMQVMGHGFDGYIQRYDRLEDLLTPETEFRFGNILLASCILMRAAAVWEKGEKALRRDPLYFVSSYIADSND